MPPDIYAEVIVPSKIFTAFPIFEKLVARFATRRSQLGNFIDAGAYIGVGTDAASPLNFHTEAMWR